ncbi:hypothetical protein [Streptomyces albofaciens]|uniref:hypothetical protein n=1 Tax=Streptomyces albofaciens TaxID=66866 RepID=UPI0012399EF1|nr:hypothetical protein [Streptomyces albofaciens]
MTHRGNIAGLHDVLIRLATELERRLDLNGDLDDVPRLIVAIDEANTTLRQLARYWETFRHKDDPKTSPAITALEEFLWAGRAARVHVIFDGRPHTAALGGMSRLPTSCSPRSSWRGSRPTPGGAWPRWPALPRRSRTRARAAATSSNTTAPTRRRRS